MKPFMDKDFLLSSGTAARLYHDFAAPLPIIDYHCHLDAKEICEDRRYENITQLWLSGDHYKWRIMRAAGVEERFVTGDAPDREKFQKWAETLPLAIGSPLYHWSHMELRQYFGYRGILNGNTAGEVWELCGAKLREEGFSLRRIIRDSRVKVLCTTDDPADSLEYHRKIASDGYEVRVLPAFRPDRVFEIESPDWRGYLGALERAQGARAEDFAGLLDILRGRIRFFHENGCRLADHGMNALRFVPASGEEADRIFRRRLAGETLSEKEILQFRTALLLFFAEEYHALDWAMQLHMGAARDLSDRLFRTLGKNAGADSIGEAVSVADLGALLNALDGRGRLPKTIFYSLNPGDGTAIETVMGCFQDGSFGKLQHGSAWWFNDHRQGIRNQLAGLASQGVLGTFVGMLTDSRSPLSYTRHEYFRRIFCDLIGTWVEEGLYPDDDGTLREIVEGVCFRNAERYFGF